MADSRLRVLWVLFPLTAMVALAFWPRALVNFDEVVYWGQARLLLHGRLLPVDGDPLPWLAAAPATFVRVPPGWPLVLASAGTLGLSGAFVCTLLFHLAGGWAVARLLVRRGLGAHLAVIYLFHPLFWPLSRTLMSDVPAAALLLLAMDAWEDRRVAFAAVALAATLLFRVAALAPALGFLWAVTADRPSRRQLIALAAGLAVSGLLILGYQKLIYGSPWRSYYASSGVRMFQPASMGQQLLLYSAGLLLIPPFVLMAIRRWDRWAKVALPVFALCVVYGYHDRSSRWWETLLGGQRLMLPAHAALLVASSAVWGRWRLFRSAPLVIFAAAVAGVTGCLLLSHLEARYRPAIEAVAACRPRAIGYNLNAARVALAVDAERYHFIDERDPAGLVDVMIAARHPLTNTGAHEDDWPIPPSLAGARCARFGEVLRYDLGGGCPSGGEPCP